MKKTSSIIFLASAIIAFVGGGVAIYFAHHYHVSAWMICLVVALYLPLCLMPLGMLFRCLEKAQKAEAVVEEALVEVAEQHDTPTVAEPEARQESVHEKWAKAMYERFGDSWVSLFSNATYPADKSTRAEIFVKLWEIASLTMDYLLVVNDDPNVLKRNKEMTNAIVEGLDLMKDVELKEFFQDPTSVQQKALIVYDLLSSQLASKQTFDVSAFGYKLELGKNK